MEKLYMRVLRKFPSLFDEKAKAEIEEMLADKPDNKYLVAVVMGPYIDNDENASRNARVNYLVFMDEVANANGPFARKDGENPYDRLSWFYGNLTEDHPLYALLQAGENGVRERKGITTMDLAEPVNNAEYTAEQRGAYDEINNEEDHPVEGFWWAH